MTHYAELQVTTNYSFLRGASSPEILVARAAALGVEALALTDHMSLAGAVRFQAACARHGIHPILGVELAPQGFRAVIDTIAPGAETARQRIIASLVNTPPASTTVVDDLATLIRTTPLLVRQFLRDLQAQGHLTVMLGSAAPRESLPSAPP